MKVKQSAIDRIKKKNIYHSIKQDYLNIWRPVIFERDDYNCQNCGTKKQLQLAHITSCYLFYKKYDTNGIEQSFRRDNLLTLCNDCHIGSQHAMLKGTDISDEQKNLGRKVFILFDKRIVARGWRTIKQLEKQNQKLDIKKIKLKKRNRKLCKCYRCGGFFKPGWGLQLGKNKFKCPLCGQEAIVTYHNIKGHTISKTNIIRGD